MSSTDGDALRRAIVAAPDDDIARLVYADWLDENGQPDRAAFIRAQVWAERAEPFGPEARAHVTAARRLLDANRGAWTGHLVRRVLRSEFRRGFVEHAEVDVAQFPRGAADLFAAEPIRSLRLARFASDATTVSLVPFFRTPHLARLTRLELIGLDMSPAEIDPLAASPHLGALTDLALNVPVTPNWFESFLTGPALPALTGLYLSDLSHLAPCLTGALGRCDHRRFRRIDLSRIPFTSEQIQKVLLGRCLRDVEELRLGWMTGAGRSGALANLDLSWGGIYWNRLRLLDLGGQGIGDDGVGQIVTALGGRKEPAPLRWLGLAHNRLGAAAVRALVRSDPAKLHLYHLDVSGNKLTLDQVDALYARFPDAVVQCRDG
jgi:uncharacterized protein (TIGR02996 family)